MHETYPLISELPKEEQEPFREWLTGQTIPAAGYYFAWDYETWKRGEEITD